MPTFSLSDIRAKALGRLDGNSILYTNPEVDYCINECLRTIALFTGFYRSTVHPGPTTPNTLVYDTPSTIIIPSTIAINGRQLQKISLRKLARKRRTWATDTTAALGQVEFWSPIGIGQFVISPKDSEGGKDFTITGMAIPPKLVYDTDVMSLENEYLDTIVEYCEHRLPLKIGGKIFADGSLALKDFWDNMQQRKKYERVMLPKYWLLESKRGGQA
jgi:hypothetical protein